MAQKIRDDKIGALSHSAGNILMAASIASPAYLTIGGQQFKVTSQLSVALPSMTANQRYQVYAVQSAGVVSLAISTRENSQGPLGYSRWKLVGSFYANAMSPVAFGSFINIKGTPISFEEWNLDISTTTTGFGTIGGTINHRGRRMGNHFIGTGFFTTGTVPASTNHTLPLFNMAIDPNKVALNQVTAANCPIVGTFGNSGTGATGYMLAATATNATKVYCADNAGSANNIDPAGPVTPGVVSSAGFTFEFSVPIVGWAHGSIEDL